MLLTFAVASSSCCALGLALSTSVFPVRHVILAVFAGFDPQRSGASFEWGHLAVVAAWGVFGAIVAIRRFRWEPSQ